METCECPIVCMGRDNCYMKAAKNKERKALSCLLQMMDAIVYLNLFPHQMLILDAKSVVQQPTNFKDVSWTKIMIIE